MRTLNDRPKQSMPVGVQAVPKFLEFLVLLDVPTVSISTYVVIREPDVVLVFGCSIAIQTTKSNVGSRRLMATASARRPFEAGRFGNW